MSELPKGWLETTLGDVVDYGATLKAEPDEISDDEWVLELEDIEKDKSKIVSRFTFADRKSKSTKNRFSKGDVLYGKLRPYLNKVVLADSDGLCTTEIVPIKRTTAVDNRYVFHWLKGPRFLSYATGISHGLNMPRLGTDAGRKAPFILAPLAEQKRIADKLDALLARVDACRERLDRASELLARFRQSVLTAAVRGDLTADWRSERGTSVDAWTTSRIGDLYQLIDGDRGPNYPKQSDYMANGSCLFLSTKNVRPFGFVFDDCTYISQAKHQQLRNGTLEENDVVVTTRGTLGNVAHYDAATARAFPVIRINSGMLIMREKVPGTVCASYLKLFIASREFATQLAEKRSGSAQPQIPAGILKTFTMAIPRVSEQREIIQTVERLFDLVGRMEERLAAAYDAATGLAPALLAKAFRGELVPQDPSDESAEKLLERLKDLTTSLGTKGKRSKRSSASAAEIE